MAQQTGLNPVEIMTETAGTRAIIFWPVLAAGIAVSPRFADAGKRYYGGWINRQTAVHQMCWRGDEQICRRRKISGMRSIGSLKLGTIPTLGRIRSLLKRSLPSGVVQARVYKTLSLLN